VPKTQHVVEYGPVWSELVAELGNPLANGPEMTGPPSLDRSDAGTYGAWFAEDDFAVPGRHAWFYGDGEDAPAGPAVTETLPVTVPDAPPIADETEPKKNKK
jgi:hypothetical protein